jgi:hypothetical protein
VLVDDAGQQRPHRAIRATSAQHRPSPDALITPSCGTLDDVGNETGDGEEPRLWGLRPLELQVALVLGFASGMGWAVITGAKSELLGRVGLFMVGFPIGVIFGIECASHYLDDGRVMRGFLRVAAIIAMLLTVVAVLKAALGS